MQNVPSLAPALTTALSRLVLERVITRFAAQACDPPHAGPAQEVHVWIRGKDEISAARARKRVRDALYSFLKGAAVTVVQE